MSNSEYPKACAVELENFPGWYRWDFIADEDATLIFSTFSRYGNGINASVKEDHGFLSMTVYDAEKIIAMVSTRVSNESGRKDNI